MGVGSGLLVQLSDPHIGATWAPADPLAGLKAAVEAVRALRPAPAAVLVTGDLADNRADSEYRQVRELLDRIDAPYFVLPGNHDDRATLRSHFDVPGEGDEPVHYAVNAGSLQLIALDTQVPGHDHGQLDSEQLSWLESTLAASPDLPTVVAMHHAPIMVGITAMDALGIAETDRRALADVVSRHPQIRRLVTGHLHRSITASLGGRTVIVAPSTYVQLTLDFESDAVQTAPEEPTGFAIHSLLDGELVSHVRTLELSR
jgi:3',5'-cyclic-AMP phosphodiesterase